MDYQKEENQTRPEILKVICILSFIGGGVSFLSYGIMYLTFDLWREAYHQGVFDFILKDEQQIQTFEIMMELPPTYFLLQTGLFALSLYGVYKMWNLKKIGFHIYTISQIMLLLALQLFIKGAPFPLFPLLLTASFVFLYFRNLSFMN